MDTCKHCNMQVELNRKGICVHCSPMVRKMYRDADRSMWYAKRGIDQALMRWENRHNEGYLPYVGAESTHDKR